ncbi:MAG TPA: lipid II flippase MurJ, partial [Rhizobiaceae bacterium]|nr:lipid II flippase MurJ [Rhizobiaceae bacterium]
QSVSRALAIFGLGLHAFVMIKAFTPGFFAREDTRTPMIFAGISVVVNVTLALTLFPTLAEAGIATAETTAGWVNAILLLATLIWRGHWGRDIALLTRIPRLVIAAAIMAVGIHFATGWLADWFAPTASLIEQIAALALIIGGAMIVYFGIAFAIGGADIGMMRRNLKRGRQAEITPADTTD